MISNFEMETHSAKSIAKNAPEKNDIFIIFSLLACCLSILILFLFTSLTIYGAVIVAVVSAMFWIPAALYFRRRRKTHKAKLLDEARLEQVLEHRKMVSTKL
jgi:O-antigen/teichoic acid export membrane protein